MRGSAEWAVDTRTAGVAALVIVAACGSMRRSVRVWSAAILLVVAGADVVAQAPAVTALVPRQQTYPAPSPDGRFIVYSSDEGGTLNLYRLELETGAIVRLTAGDFEDSAATWSPDGTRLVFQREDAGGQRDLWEVAADGSGAHNLTATPAAYEQHPRYSPDGGLIIFDSDRDEAEPGAPESDRNYEIYSMPRSGGTPRRITTWQGWDMYGSFAPDGRRIVWRRALQDPAGGARNFEIFVRDLQTGHETNLTDHPAQDTNPHWSPAGDWIVFISTREGSADIFVIRPDGSDLRRIAAGAARTLGYARPSFSPDGTRIFANRVTAGVTDIVVIAFPGTGN